MTAVPSGARPADPLTVFSLPGLHVFVGGYVEMPCAFRCERCKKRWDTLEDALEVECR